MAQQQSMFGPTPEELQMDLMQQQQASNWKQGMDWGSKDLGQQISAASFMGGQGIGQGIGQLGQAAGFIPEDPRLAEARKLMEIRKSLMEAEIDPQDIDAFYPEMIRRLNAAGLTDQANKAMKQYTQAQTAQGNLEARRAELEVKQAAAEKARREAQFPGYRRLATLDKTITENPRNAAIIDRFEQSITRERPAGDSSILAELETPAGKEANKPIFFTSDNKAVYADSGGEYINEMIPNPDTKAGGMVRFKRYGNFTGRPPSAPSQVINFPSKEAEMEYGTRLAALKPTMEKYVTDAARASETLPRIDRMINLVENNPVFSGFGADFQLGIANFLKTYGLDIQSGKVTASQILDAVVGPEILAAMQQLGGQDSNEELRKITAMQPNRVMTKEAMLHTASVAKNTAARALLKEQNYREYLRTPGSKTIDFDFARGFMPGQQDPVKTFPVPVWDSKTMKSYNTPQEAEAARKQSILAPGGQPIPNNILEKRIEELEKQRKRQ